MTLIEEAAGFDSADHFYLGCHESFPMASESHNHTMANCNTPKEEGTLYTTPNVIQNTIRHLQYHSDDDFDCFNGLSLVTSPHVLQDANKPAPWQKIFSNSRKRLQVLVTDITISM
jgi:hypothetical protein